MPSVLLVNETVDERDVRAHSARVRLPRDRRESSLPPITSPSRIRPTSSSPTSALRVQSAGELTRRLRNNHRTSAVRIIVLTTVLRPQDANVVLKAGADTFLEKPVSGSALTAEIKRLLSSSARSITPSIPAAGVRSVTVPSFIGHVGPSSSELARETNGRERLRYMAGWFCTTPACRTRNKAEPY